MSLQATDRAEDAALGNGSFGYVFAVRHKDKQNYALKVIDMKKLRVERGMSDNSKMMQEVFTLAELQHAPYIARYDDFKEVNGVLHAAASGDPKDWLVIKLELCTGGTLQSVLDNCRAQGRGLPTADVRKYFAQLVEAFNFMAEKKIVHRDMKLDNVCLSAPGGDCRVVDLGFARKLGGEGPSIDAHQSDTLCKPRGNKRYRSPENDGKRSIDHKDDMWALGLMLCEMLTGTTVNDLLDGDYARVWPNYSKQMAGWIKNAKVRDENLGRIASRLLHPEPPADRFSAEEAARELRNHRFVSDEPPPFLPVGWLDQLHLADEIPATLAEALKVGLARNNLSTPLHAPLHADSI